LVSRSMTSVSPLSKIYSDVGIFFSRSISVPAFGVDRFLISVTLPLLLNFLPPFHDGFTLVPPSSDLLGLYACPLFFSFNGVHMFMPRRVSKESEVSLLFCASPASPYKAALSFFGRQRRPRMCKPQFPFPFVPHFLTLFYCLLVVILHIPLMSCFLSTSASVHRRHLRVSSPPPRLLFLHVLDPVSFAVLLPPPPPALQGPSITMLHFSFPPSSVSIVALPCFFLAGFLFPRTVLTP